VAETVARSGAGAAFQSGDPDALVQTAVKLLSADLASLGLAGRRYAEAHHGWDTILDQHFRVYRRILGR
jgi:glycosyltransferase involved in cell wall biosynthesis